MDEPIASLLQDESVAPLITVIVVNYNGRAHIGRCLESLCADDPPWLVEILVVDNASTDGSERIAQHYAAGCARARLLHSPINLGYAGGVNLALPQARGRYVAVLNMDIVVTAGWLVEPLLFMEQNPMVGATSPLILLADNPSLVNAIGQDVHVTGLGFNRGLGRPARLLEDSPIRVSGIHGAAFIVRREILERIGGLDATGFLYHEDVELSWLLQMMGYRLYCVPRSQVLHEYSLTMYPEKLFLLERNRVAMLFAHLGCFFLGLMAPMLACTEVMMWGYCCLRGARFVRAKAGSYAWVIAHRATIRERRRSVGLLRRRSDWEVLNRLAWRYPWRQFLTLGRERGESCRQPTGGLPVQMKRSS